LQTGTLVDLGIVKESTIQLVARLRGGKKNGPAPKKPRLEPPATSTSGAASSSTAGESDWESRWKILVAQLPAVKEDPLPKCRHGRNYHHEDDVSEKACKWIFDHPATGTDGKVL
jgi:hypothetical protein